MPRQRVPSERVESLRARFQLVVDEAFNGNFSMAARELHMPVGTVHKYYHDGPRRISAVVAERARFHLRHKDSVVWLIGEGGQDDEPPWAASEAISQGGDGRYAYPVIARWRVDRVIEQLKQEGLSREESLDLFFGRLVDAVDKGLLDEAAMLLVASRHPTESQREAYVERLKATSKRRAELTHQECESWETLLAISHP